MNAGHVVPRFLERDQYSPGSLPLARSVEKEPRYEVAINYNALRLLYCEKSSRFVNNKCTQSACTLSIRHNRLTFTIHDT